jgi:hypothetical protein
MAMTWANDETGLLVIAGTGKPDKKAKAKAPKPVKPPKPDKTAAASRASRPSMPGLPPPREPMPAPLAQGSLLQARPSVPIGVPIVREPMRGMTTGASTKVHGRRTTKVQHGHPVLRFLGILFVVIVIAGGGFAAGALTELGTEAEAYVLGPPVPPAPTPDPRVPGLEAEVQRLQGELAEERKISIEMKAAGAAAVDDKTIAAGDDDDDDEAREASKEKKKKKKRARRNRDRGRIDL